MAVLSFKPKEEYSGRINSKFNINLKGQYGGYLDKQMDKNTNK